MNNIDHSKLITKLGIESLNPMQEEAILAIETMPEVIILSPTGTGKTLAFVLPILKQLDLKNQQVQILIITPTRELTIQIEQVIRSLGAGIKTNAVYGGRTASSDKVNLKHTPLLVVGTPGRVAHHLRKGNIDAHSIKILVLDEFDKSLEIGFEDEMEEIINFLPFLEKKVLTSATKSKSFPNFVKIERPLIIDHLSSGVPKLEVRLISSPSKDKLETLYKSICHLGNLKGIIFCNYKDSIQRISDYLNEKGISHTTFNGSMEQIDRERSLIKFRNGTSQILLATDLAARGIDVPEIDYIIHYHLPHKSEEFTHRNGRTARMNADGKAYVLKWKEEDLPEFIVTNDYEEIKDAPAPAPSPWVTLYLSGGRKDKISKGDVAGFLMKQGGIPFKQVGYIDLLQDCSFVAVAKQNVKHILKSLNDGRLKKKKIRIKKID